MYDLHSNGPTLLDQVWAYLLLGAVIVFFALIGVALRNTRKF